MGKLPALKPRQMVKVLKGAGFYIHHQKGSHVQLRHFMKVHLRVTVPYHTNFDLHPFVLNSILKQAELSREEFLRLLKE